MEQVPKSLLKTRQYALYWISSLFSNIGTWMQQVAQPWVILSLSHSSFFVGLDSFIMNAPGWVFTLWGGSLADRFDRKKIVLICQTIQFLFVFNLFVFILFGWIKIWIILASSLVIGITDSLSMPAFQSIIPSLVKDKEVSKAVALNSIQFNLSRILGPAVAGIMIATYGAAVCYGANLISFLPFFLSLYWIYPRKAAAVNSDQAHASPLGTIQFKKIISERKFQAPLLSVLVITLLCNPLIIFCSVLIKDVYHGGSHELGWAMSSFGVGGVLGGMVASLLSDRISESRRVANFTAIFLGLILILLAFVPSLIVFYLFLAFAGVALTLANTWNNTQLQTTATNQARGHIISLFQLALHGGMSVGSLLTGVVAAQFGIQKAICANGVLAICFQLLIIYFYKEKERKR